MAEETAQPVADDQAQAVVATPGDTEGKAVEQPQQQTDPGAGAADETPAVELSEEQKASWNALPPEQRKHLNRLFTQKSQELAAAKKKYGHIEVLADALESRPDEVIEALARQRGFQISKPAPTPQEQSAKDAHAAELEAQYGPDGAKAILAAAERIVESKIKPLQEYQQQTITQQQKAQAAAEIGALKQKYPDFDNFAPQMNQMAQQLGLQPGPGATYGQLAEMLYLYATKDRVSAQQTKAVIDKLNQSARAAETPAQPVPSNRVAPTRPKDLSFDKQFAAAAEAATRGELWSD